ncbi:hypothetical protein FQA39_LY10664 [Lamprigera yunnana]|nr:hypothetical protein FQA39_LY10664 [Lamprigera yunnana]
MNAKKIIVLAAYFLIALLTVVEARNFITTEKKAQDRPFMMSSRYGRAGGGTTNLNGPKHVIVAPRTDKFFLASRYGKRSNVLSSEPLAYISDTMPFCGSDEGLSCAYTGFSNLYRCAQRAPLRNLPIPPENDKSEQVEDKTTVSSQQLTPSLPPSPPPVPTLIIEMSQQSEKITQKQWEPSPFRIPKNKRVLKDEEMDNAFMDYFQVKRNKMLDSSQCAKQDSKKRSIENVPSKHATRSFKND